MRLLFCFFIFLSAPATYAVDAIICDHDNNKSIEIADFYEAEKLRKMNFEDYQNQTQDEIEVVLWQKLALQSKSRFIYFEKEFSDSQFLAKTRLQSHIRFENNWKNSYVFIEKNCHVQTFADVYKKQFQLDPDYIIDEVIWNQLTPFQKLATKSHLLFAKESLSTNTSPSEVRQIQLRYLNSLFWSTAWEELSTQRRFEISQQLFFETESSLNFIFSIQNKNIEFWNQNIIKKGPLKPGALSQLSDGQVFVQKYGFFEQDEFENILSLPHQTELEFQTPLGILKSKNCITQFFATTQMKYTCFSPKQKIQIQKSNLRLDFFANDQDNAPAYFYPNGSIYSARNIKGHYLTSWGQTLHFNIQGEGQFAEIHFNQQYDVLYISHVQEPIRLQTKAGWIETDKGSFLSFYPSGQLKCANAKNRKLWLISKNQKKHKIEGVGFCLTEEGYYHPPGENNLYISFTDSFKIKETL